MGQFSLHIETGRAVLQGSLPGARVQRAQLFAQVKGGSLAQWYDAVRHILLGIIWRKTAADSAALLLRALRQDVEKKG